MQHLVCWKIQWQTVNGSATSACLTSTIQSLAFLRILWNCMYYLKKKKEEAPFLFSCCVNFGTCSFHAAPAAQRQKVVSVLSDSCFFYIYVAKYLVSWGPDHSLPQHHLLLSAGQHQVCSTSWKPLLRFHHMCLLVLEMPQVKIPPSLLIVLTLYKWAIFA